MRLLISGYYGMGNVGDEAVLAGLLGELFRQAPDWEVTVLSGNPVATRRQHGVAAVPRFAPLEVIRAVRQADIVVSGGGGLLQDATSLRSLLYYAAVLWLARLARKRTAILAQSIGPLRTRLGRTLTRMAAQRADLVTVRDESSAGLLAKIGVGRLVEVTADPAFLVEPEPSVSAQSADLGLCLRSWRGGERTVQAVIEGVGRWADQEGASVAVWPFHSPADDKVAEQALGRLGPKGRLVPPYRQPGAAAAIIGEFELVVAARLHALILASVACVPWLGIGYDAKVMALAKATGLAALPPEAVTPEAVQAAIGSLRREREQARAALAGGLPRWQSMARRNVELLVRTGAVERAVLDGRLGSGGRAAPRREDDGKQSL